MLIKVTREHIARAAPFVAKRLQDLKEPDYLPDGDSIGNRCPVALALKEALQVHYVIAESYKLKIGKFPDDNLFIEVFTPDDAATWINSYDLLEKEEDLLAIEPFEFELDLSEVKL